MRAWAFVLMERNKEDRDSKYAVIGIYSSKILAKSQMAKSQRVKFRCEYCINEVPMNELTYDIYGCGK